MEKENVRSGSAAMTDHAMQQAADIARQKGTELAALYPRLAQGCELAAQAICERGPATDVIEGMREALVEEHRLQVADGLRLPPPDRERIAKALWESQRVRIKNPDGINARLSWRDKSVPEMFWHHYELDADAAITALGLPDEPPEPDDPEDRDPNERVSIPRIEILNRDKRITALTKALEYIAVSNSPSAATAKAALALPDSKPDKGDA